MSLADDLSAQISQLGLSVRQPEMFGDIVFLNQILGARKDALKEEPAVLLERGDRYSVFHRAGGRIFYCICHERDAYGPFRCEMGVVTDIASVSSLAEAHFLGGPLPRRCRWGRIPSAPRAKALAWITSPEIVGEQDAPEESAIVSVERLIEAV